MIANVSPLDGQRITERLHALARFTDVPDTLTRLTLSPSHGQALREVERWFGEAGLSTRVDALGTVRGLYPARSPDAPVLLLGSHIDSVRDGGMFDGDLGVLLALAVAEDLARQNRLLPFAIEVVAFGDEEGVRFPSTMSGSRALAGRLGPNALDEQDRDGVTRRDELRKLGLDPDRAPLERVDPEKTLGFVEVHIEQGPLLQREDLAVGVVTAIQGSTRGLATVRGEAGHAGTLPMEGRHDALAAAAEMVLALEAVAAADPALRATVGRLEVANGSTNVVPGLVTFTTDTRSHDDARKKEAVDEIERRFHAIASRRGVSVAFERTYNSSAAPCDARFQEKLAQAAERCGQRPFHLASGAGHDAMSFKDVVPLAMLFVRCRDGISHNPAEYCAPEDIGVAARVLAAFVSGLAEDHA